MEGLRQSAVLLILDTMRLFAEVRVTDSIR